MYISNNSNIGMATLLQQNKNCMKTLANGGGNIIVSNVVGGTTATQGGLSVATTSSTGVTTFSSGSIVLPQTQTIYLTNGATGASGLLNYHQQHTVPTTSTAGGTATTTTRLVMPHEMISLQLGNIVTTSGSSLAAIAGNNTSATATTQGAFLVAATATTTNHTTTSGINSFQQQFLQHAALMTKPLVATSVRNAVGAAKSQSSNSSAHAYAPATHPAQQQYRTQYGTSTLQQIKQQMLQQPKHSTNPSNSTAINNSNNNNSNNVTTARTTTTIETVMHSGGGATISANTVPNGNSSTTTTLTAGANEQEPEPEIDIVINNVVCSFSVRCHLNLRDIALNGFNVEYRRENGMVTMKLRRPYTTASIWSSGRITCTGATSESQAKIAARRYARCLYKLGFPVRFNNFRVVNVLGTCSMPWAIKIVNFSEKYKKEASYEPELHPGVTYKLRFPKATLKIFSTGSITVTAASVDNVQAAIEHIYPLVFEFRKKRSPEEQEHMRLKRLHQTGGVHHDVIEIGEPLNDNVIHSTLSVAPSTSKCLQPSNHVSTLNHLNRKRKRHEPETDFECVVKEEVADDPESIEDETIIMYTEYDPDDLIEGPDDEDEYDDDDL